MLTVQGVTRHTLIIFDAYPKAIFHIFVLPWIWWHPPATASHSDGDGDGGGCEVVMVEDAEDLISLCVLLQCMVTASSSSAADADMDARVWVPSRGHAEHVGRWGETPVEQSWVPYSDMWFDWSEDTILLISIGKYLIHFVTYMSWLAWNWKMFNLLGQVWIPFFCLKHFQST